MNNILAQLGEVRTVMIAGHTRPDGDCMGSCLGLYHYIKENYPETDVDVRLESVPESYKVIPGSDRIITDYSDGKVYDLFIALDASDRSRLASAIPYFDNAGKRICIDHHISNPHYADEDIVRADASSTCEILADLMDKDKISYNTAFALYVGIICDSGVFKYSCTGRHTMEIAGMLMEKGVPYTELIDGVFYQRTYLQNRLLGRCLLNSFREFDGLFTGTFASREVMDEFGAGHEDLEGIIDQLRLTKGTEVAMLASENTDGSLKFSLRSCQYVDVSSIAGQFGGGGHVRAAGFTSYESYEDTLAKVLKGVKEQLR